METAETHKPLNTHALAICKKTELPVALAVNVTTIFHELVPPFPGSVLAVRIPHTSVEETKNKSLHCKAQVYFTSDGVIHR